METDQIKQLYYSIGAVSRKFAVRPSTIRFWLEAFQVTVKRNRRGDRFFTETDIRKLTEIHYLLKVRKFKISGAKQELGIG